MSDGGYQRNELWSERGLARRDRHQRPCRFRVGSPLGPVGRICWFEADAYARFACLSPADRKRMGTRRPALRGMELIGEVWEWTSSGFDLSRLRGLSLPRILGGLLRRRLPCAARRLLGRRPVDQVDHLPQLGPPTTAPACSPGSVLPPTPSSHLEPRHFRVTDHDPRPEWPGASR